MKERIYAIFISGFLTVLGIWGIIFVTDTIMFENSAESFQLFDGLVGLLILTVFLAIAFVYQSILGLVEAYHYINVHRIHTVVR